jgi:DNA-binding LytR/AlgR family response regulator
MDIQLADGLSFEIFEKVKIDCPVIFLTAFDQYAIEAFKVNGIDYILKPFDKKTLTKALEKYRNLSSHFSVKTVINNEIIELLKNSKQPAKSTYLVSSGEKYFPVSVSDIALFYIDNGVTYIHTFAGKKHSISQTLEEVEQNVDGKLFYRANRQNLVNFNAIREIEHYFNRKLALKLTVQFKNTIEISKTKATDFLDWMENR